MAVHGGSGYRAPVIHRHTCKYRLLPQEFISRHFRPLPDKHMKELVIISHLMTSVSSILGLESTPFFKPEMEKS